jgi:signal transduction histidine kinase
MDPTTAIPVHFTLQALGIAAGALLLAWSLVRNLWIGALGAGMFAIGEGLHAGRLLEMDDDPALVALRFVGVALLSVAAVGSRIARRGYALGAGLLVVATVWGAAVGGGVADPTLGPHFLLAAGSLLLGGWAVIASRDSVRLRVLTALVGMLAIAVVVGGGAVSRVAALDKRNEQLRQLGSASKAVATGLTDSAGGLERRAALLSPLVADELAAPGATVQVRAGLRTDALEVIVAVDTQGTLRASVFSGPDVPVYDATLVAASAMVREAIGGAAASGFEVYGRGLAIVGAAPVFRPGLAPDPGQIVGVVAIAQSRSPEGLRQQALPYAPDAEIVLAGRSSVSTEPSLLGVQPTPGADDIVVERLATAEGTRPAATATLGDGVRLVVVGSDAGIVDAATGLLRAMLIAILTAALLAVVIALWLSTRVTRPILDLAAGAEQVKADFLSSLSHELRTPLTPIRGYTEILRRGRVPARRAADYLDEIGEAAGRLERIITLLLDVAAQDAGRFRVDARDPRPDELLDSSAERWAHTGRRHPIAVDAPASLPRVHADPDAMARVLDELIDNAVKFSPDGGPIELRARKTRAGVEFSVADRGIGVSPELAAEFTQAFSQMESGDRRRFGGLGLGLTYVSGVLAAHDASLSIDTDADAGTTFSFVLRTASMVSRMPARTGRRVSRRDADS